MIAVVTDIGGGLNVASKKFRALLQAVEDREVKTLVRAHQDRLVRCGFPWFADLCATHSCEMLVLNQETLSPEAEMVQDLMTIVPCFSSRFYCRRHYRKALDAVLTNEGNPQ